METIQTQLPQCPRCGEKIKITVNSIEHKTWRCKSCGKYFTFPKPKKACQACGKLFEQIHRNQKYCCEECKPKRATKIKTCPICGTEFQGYSKTCSSGCYVKVVEKQKAEQKAERKLRRSKLPKIACLWCGELFRPSFNTASFDCPDCSYQYRKMTRKIYKLFNFANPQIIQQELDKLKEQGKNYVLPEVRP